jgi:hypothetical protein
MENPCLKPRFAPAAPPEIKEFARFRENLLNRTGRAGGGSRARCWKRPETAGFIHGHSTGKT